jgi:hypothetical protein
MLEHVTLLLAAMALAPAVTLTLEMSEGEYPTVHSTSEGCALPDAVIVTGRVTTAPGAALPDPIATVTDCAIACVAAMASNAHVMPRIWPDFEKEPEKFIRSVHNRVHRRANTLPAYSRSGIICRGSEVPCGPRPLSLSTAPPKCEDQGKARRIFEWPAATAAHSYGCTLVARHTRGNYDSEGSRR